MPKPKIDRVKLSQLLSSGKSGREIAQHFGVSDGAVSKAKKELNINVVKSVALEDAHRVVSKSLDAIGQLQKINTKANELLDEVEQTPELRLRAMGEIRNQLRLQLEIFQTLYDMRTVQEFQSEVLNAIAEEAPGVRERIVRRLKEKKAMRYSVQLR